MPTASFPTVVSSTYDSLQPIIPKPSHGIKEGVKASTLIQTFDSGHEQRRQKSPPRKTFEIQYNVLTKNQYFTIRDFFLQVLNSTPFYWTHPIEKVQYLVRFDMDTFQGENFSHGASGALFKLQLRLLQVWS